MLPPFCISVSDPYKPCRDKLSAEGVIAYETNAQVAEVRACVWFGVSGHGARGRAYVRLETVVDACKAPPPSKYPIHAHPTKHQNHTDKNNSTRR